MATVIDALAARRVDVDLLRQQRNWLLTAYPADPPPEVAGLVNLLDHMLDVAEGFA